MLSVAAALAATVYLYTQLDNEIRRHVEQVLGRHYKDLVVTVRSARLVEDQGIELRGLTVVNPRALSGPETMVVVDEVFLECDTSLQELLQGKTQVRAIKVRRPKLRAVRDAGGRWNVASLLPLPQLGDSSPVIEIEDAVLELVDAGKAPEGNLTLEGIRLRVTSEASDGSRPEKRSIRATFSTEFAQSIDVTGTLEPETGYFHLKGNVTGLEVRPELRQALPPNFAGYLDNLPSLEASITAEFEVTHDPAAEVPLRFMVDAHLERGRLVDDRLPYPLTDLTATIHFTNQTIAIENLTALSGQSLLRLSGRREGFAPNSPLTLEGSVERLVLESKLFQALPGTLGGLDLWRKFQPAGVVNVEQFRLTFDGHTWHPEIALRCLGGSFTYEKFPYPLVQTTGMITLAGNHLSLDLVAHTTSQPVTIEGEIDNPGRHFTGKVRVEGKNLTVDEKLILALPDKGREVVRSLSPAGTVDVVWHGSRKDPRVAKMHTRLDLKLKECSIRYAKFPYPVSGIHGTVEAVDNQWWIRDLAGRNDSGLVTCNGTLTPTASGSELSLTFTGENVPLEEELRDALQPSAQRLWNDLKPHGRVNLTAQLHSVSGQPTPNLKVWIEPHANTVSIEPDFFRYRLEKLRGQFLYVDRHVDFNHLQAKHGRTTIATGGSCDFHPDGSWQLTFKDLTVDRLRADRVLLVALPAGLRSAVSQLNPSGPVNMRGTLEFSQGPRRDMPIASRWALSFDLHQSNLNCGVSLASVSGRVDLAGTSLGTRFQSSGELAIDSLNFLDHQFTEVRGPIWLDESRVLLGALATQQQRVAPRNLTAKLYGGTLVASGHVVLDDVPRYQLDASLKDGDLERFAKESIRGRQQLRGKVFANVSLHGTGSTVHGLQGNGAIYLREAVIYELPLIVTLFKVLRATAPDTIAFTQADMRFRVQGNRLYFTQIDLLGDAVSLYGKGEINFDGEIEKLVFHSIVSVVGRNDFSVPLLKNLIGEASQQIMQIHVGGTLDNPKIHNEVLPGLNQALQQLQGESKPPGTWPSRLPDPRRLFQSQREQPRNRK